MVQRGRLTRRPAKENTREICMVAGAEAEWNEWCASAVVTFAERPETETKDDNVCAVSLPTRSCQAK